MLNVNLIAQDIECVAWLSVLSSCLNVMFGFLFNSS